MEVYVLDALRRRSEVIDQFESLIWTERWGAWGDFELSIHSTPETRRLLTVGTYLSMNLSYRVMVVETIEKTFASSGVKTLKVKGRSWESLLEGRVARPDTSSLSVMPTWNITAPPAYIMRLVFNLTCSSPGTPISDKDILSNLYLVRHPSIPASTIPETPDNITVAFEPQPVYDILKTLSNTWALGFRLLRLDSTPNLYFDVYAGTDRTFVQTERSPVIFAPELDNLQNTSEFHSIESEKNVAYVISQNGFLEVYAPNADTTSTNVDRKVLVVKADDITLPTGAVGSAERIALDAALAQRGKEALSEHRATQAFDGEINQNSQYQYQVDYWLGDLVELRNEDGVGNQMRVTEQIFVSDNQGERAYPTLELNAFVNTGSWLSWEPSKEWSDFESDPIKWAELP